VILKEIADAPSVGTMCRVFRQVRKVTTSLGPGLDPSDSIVYVFLTHNVVSKMVMCTRAGQVCVLPG
jgi:hypothetical protein